MSGLDWALVVVTLVAGTGMSLARQWWWRCGHKHTGWGNSWRCKQYSAWFDDCSACWLRWVRMQPTKHCFRSCWEWGVTSSQHRHRHRHCNWGQLLIGYRYCLFCSVQLQADFPCVPVRGNVFDWLNSQSGERMQMQNTWLWLWLCNSRWKMASAYLYVQGSAEQRSTPWWASAISQLHSQWLLACLVNSGADC